MRKYVIGILIGLTLSFAVGAHAEVVSMIGKTVDGMFKVTADGKPLEKEAIVIEGTTYLPVRSFGESIGYTVTFDADLGVIMTKTVTANVYAVNEITATRNQLQTLQTEREQLVNSFTKNQDDASTQYQLYRKFENPIYLEEVRESGMNEQDTSAHHAAKTKWENLQVEAEQLKQKIETNKAQQKEIDTKLTLLIEQQKAALQP